MHLDKILQFFIPSLSNALFTNLLSLTYSLGIIGNILHCERCVVSSLTTTFPTLCIVLIEL